MSKARHPGEKWVSDEIIRQAVANAQAAGGSAVNGEPTVRDVAAQIPDVDENRDDRELAYKTVCKRLQSLAEQGRVDRHRSIVPDRDVHGEVETVVLSNQGESA